MLDNLGHYLNLYILFIGFLVAVILLRKLFNKNNLGKLPYKKKDSILTVREQQYFSQLRQRYGENYHIFCQVALDRIINTTDQKNFYTYWNKINKKSIDYVLVDKETFKTVKLIELNDKTHSYSKRVKRDEFLKKLCDATELELEFIN